MIMWNTGQTHTDPSRPGARSLEGIRNNTVGVVFTMPDYDRLGPIDDKDHIIFVEDPDHVENDCDMIAEEVWLTTTPPPLSVKGIKPVDHMPITRKLRDWIKCFPDPYVSLADKKDVARILGITVVQVTHFCNNYRKRHYKPQVYKPQVHRGGSSRGVVSNLRG
jgi:hypothetical protein